MEFIYETFSRSFWKSHTGFTLLCIQCFLLATVVDSQPSRLSSNSTAVCPEGWHLATASSKQSSVSQQQKLCLRVQEQVLSWERARLECRKSKGFLVKLDSFLHLNKMMLADSLKLRGVNTVWTGMHHEHGTLLWDELRPRMVKSKYMFGDNNEKNDGGWTFDKKSFELTGETCGRLGVADADSSEDTDDQAIPRQKRSPSTLVGNPRVGEAHPGGQHARTDNEDIVSNRSPSEEKSYSTSQAVQQEGSTDNLGETHGTGDVRTAGKTTHITHPSPKTTTASAITTTDQSNVEDYDDVPAVTKPSSSQTNTSVTVSSSEQLNSTNTSSTDKNNGSNTINSTLEPYKSANTTLEPQSPAVVNTSVATTTRSQTTTSTHSSTSNNDLVNQYLQSSLDAATNTDISGSISDISGSVSDISSSGIDISGGSVDGTAIGSSILEDPSPPGKDNQENTRTSPSAFVNINTTEPQSNSLDSSDDLTSHQVSNETSPTISGLFKKILRNVVGAISSPVVLDKNKTITISPNAYNTSDMPGSLLKHEPALNVPSDEVASVRVSFDSLAPQSSLTAPNSTDTSNSVLDSDDTQTKDSGKSDDQISDAVTPKSVVGHLKSLLNNLFASGSGSKDSNNLNDQTLSSTTAKTVTGLPADLTGNSALKGSLTNNPINKITNVPTSTIRTATEVPTSATGTTTEVPTSTTGTTTTEVPTSTTGTTTEVPTSTTGTTTEVPTSTTGTTTTDVPTSTTGTTTDSPTSTIRTTTEVSTSTTGTTTTDVPTSTTGTTTDSPTSTIRTTTEVSTSTTETTTEVPTSTTGTTTDSPTSTIRTTTEVSTSTTETTTEVPTSTTGTTTDSPTSTIRTTTEVSTSTIETTTEVPTSTTGTTTDSPTSTIRTTTEVPRSTTGTTTEVPTSATGTTTEVPTSTTGTTTEVPTSTTGTTTEVPTSTTGTTTEVPTSTPGTTTEVPTSTKIAIANLSTLSKTTNTLDNHMVPLTTTTVNSVIITTSSDKENHDDDVDSGPTFLASSANVISNVTSDDSYNSNSTNTEATHFWPASTTQSSSPDLVHNMVKVTDPAVLNKNSAIFISPANANERATDELDVSSDQQDSLTTTMSLDLCQQEHASACFTEAVEELTLVGHCERSWYGHRLLDRCYKPVEFLLKAIEARQNCLQYSATLATVDTSFYGNITAMMLGHFLPGSGVWVDVSLNLDIPGDSQCAALMDGGILLIDCNTRLAFICQKDAQVHVSVDDDEEDGRGAAIFVQNMTSFHPQTLWCPLRMSDFDDVILWFKDGRPVFDQDDGTSFNHRNGQLPNRLGIDLTILERVGEGGARIPKPAMLQGQYWCEIWRWEPFRRVASRKIILKFTDVITLVGNITTKPTDHVTAATFNRMGHVSGLPEVMERRLATINKNITHFMRTIFPVVRDIISFMRSTNPVTGKSDFTTHISLATGDLTPALRANLADLYLSVLYQALDISQNILQSEWNLTAPARHAVTVRMADMCAEANLMDKSSGMSATFPSTPYNSRAVSIDTCNTVPIGSAVCEGDLQAGAYWSRWRVNPCTNSGQLEPHDVESGKNEIHTSQNYGNTSRENDGSKKPTLWQLKDVRVHTGNVQEVTKLLEEVCEQTDELSSTDIHFLVQVVDHIVSVPRLPMQISERLIRAANKVLDAPEIELIQAEQQHHAPSKLLADLEVFGRKVDLNTDHHVRVVTPNVAMELWSLDDSDDVVIGFGARGSQNWSAPLSEPKIQIIRDRLWAEQHLQTFDVAVELPESLVKNTVRFANTPLRLTMFIYRKIGLFLEDGGSNPSRGIVNSAIISASLGGRKIVGLEDKVRLVFKPFQESTTRDKSTRCVFWNIKTQTHATWSDYGCSYNGTINGRDVCLCNHLTNFAILTDFYGDDLQVSPDNETALTVLTIVGLILSIIGLVATIVTFLAFKKLRQGRAQQTLFNMAVALLCFQVTFLVGVRQTSLMPVCLTVSVLLHYFILVSFVWMLIEAVLQYLTFVKVLGTYVTRYTLKTVVPAWGLPVLPVIAVLGTDYRLYLGRVHYCWMNLQAFYYAFALPVGIIIVFNMIMFVIIIISIATRPKGLRSSHTDSNRTRSTSLKAAITIFVLLGLTWIFGYLSIEDARLPFQYAFTILSSLQGFLIFLLMVARRRQVREQWKIMCCTNLQRKRNKLKKLSPTFSNSTTSSNSNNTLPNNTYSSDSIKMSSSVGLHRSSSLDA